MDNKITVGFEYTNANGEFTQLRKTRDFQSDLKYENEVEYLTSLYTDFLMDAGFSYDLVSRIKYNLEEEEI